MVRFVHRIRGHGLRTQRWRHTFKIMHPFLPNLSDLKSLDLICTSLTLAWTSQGKDGYNNEPVCDYSRLVMSGEFNQSFGSVNWTHNGTCKSMIRDQIRLTENSKILSDTGNNYKKTRFSVKIPILSFKIPHQNTIHDFILQNKQSGWSWPIQQHKN